MPSETEDRTAASQPQPPPQDTNQSQIHRYMFEPLEANIWAESQLLILTFGTGIQDAANFSTLPTWGTSLATFLAGAIITGQMGNYIGPRRRWWQIFSNLAQTVMSFGAAWLQFSHGTQHSGPWAVAAITLLAFSSGAQVAATRASRMTEISIAMATAAWVDLVIDPKLFVKKNRARNRRVSFLAALALGSLAGAFMHSDIGSPLALTMSPIGTALIISILLIVRSERGQTRNFGNCTTTKA
ncbi:hypothetical protein LTR70_005504 [Exophiala xenobiotica]|uniref:DUF1275 domain-containing protein n=1 Tax=Lithohypha guttulata TaxID=1690604 RepID=A0ABR0KFU2_9EURO|nr:hypothetical protein LTR24_003871 [Lithohypha guttulata]KAK5318361.1 hypothetical protein LTR70_005504 [Exophiala xenobiotica]